jgi:biotin carboxylase
MILGAGQYQIPLIKLAQQEGFETIAVSEPGEYPGFSAADKSYEVDVREKEKILRIARQEKIHGILTDQTDIAVPTVAYVAEEMGLPGIGYQTAVRFTDKYTMRQHCEEIGIPVPRYLQASSLTEAHHHALHVGFPLVVKPADSQGSRGVAKVHSRDDLEQKFENALACSVCGRVVLEEYIPGREIVVQGFVSDYEVTNLITGDRELFDLPDMFIPSQGMFPASIGEELEQKILEMNLRLIRGFGPRFGITHTEYLVNDDMGEVRLGETAIRGGGVFISSDLVPLVCGVDINRLLIDIAAGKENVRMENGRRRGGAAAYLSFYLPEGVIRRVIGVDRVKSLPGVHRAYLQGLEVGKRTKPMTDKATRLGPILIAGRDRSACQKTIHQIQETLVVEVETSRGIEGIRW